MGSDVSGEHTASVFFYSEAGGRRLSETLRCTRLHEYIVSVLTVGGALRLINPELSPDEKKLKMVRNFS
jgi:hypothetical protein